jgi:hypothetical protein
MNIHPAPLAEAAAAARPGHNGPARAHLFAGNRVTPPALGVSCELAGASVPAVFSASFHGATMRQGRADVTGTDPQHITGTTR